jgi:hypothetical protein
MYTTEELTALYVPKAAFHIMATLFDQAAPPVRLRRTAYPVFMSLKVPVYARMPPVFPCPSSGAVFPKRAIRAVFANITAKNGRKATPLYLCTLFPENQTPAIGTQKTVAPAAVRHVSLMEAVFPVLLLFFPVVRGVFQKTVWL